jgi:O-antigen ligase
MNNDPSTDSWDIKAFCGAVYLMAISAPLSLVAAQAAAFFIIIIGCWLMFRGCQRNVVSPWGVVFVMGLLLMVLLSSTINGFQNSLPQLKKSWILIGFLPLAFFSRYYSRYRMLNLLIMATSLASLIGAIRYFAGDVDRAAPYSGGYTTMAIFEAVLIPIALGLWLSSNHKKRYLYIVAIFIMALGLITSQTRAGWLGVLVALTMLLYRKHWEIVIQIIVLSIIAMVVIPGGPKFVMRKLTFGARTEITTGRNIIWSQGISLIPNMPIMGYGPSSFKRLMPRELILKTGDPSISSWHSTPLEILLESGFLGLLSILGIWITSLWLAGRRFKTQKDDKWLHLSILSGLVAIYLAGLTTNIMRDFMLSALSILLWAGIFVKQENNVTTE